MDHPGTDAPRRAIAPAAAPHPSAVSRRVAENAALLLGVQLLLKALALVFNVYIVRTLGDAQFGRFAAAIAYVGSFAMLTDLGTTTLSMRTIAGDEHTISRLVPDLISFRMLMSGMAIVAIPASAYWLGKPVDAVQAIAVASSMLALYAFSGPLDTALLARERFVYSAGLSLLQQAVFMAVGFAVLTSGHGYVSLLTASVCAVAVMGIATGLLVRYRLGWSFQRPDPRRWPPLVRASLPFGIIGAVNEFSSRFDTVFMSFVLTDAAVGWYSVSVTLVTMALLPAQSVGLSLFPSLVRSHDGGRGSIRASVQLTLRYFLLLAIPLALGGSLLADRIITVLYGETFAPAIGVMRIVLWGLPLMFLLELLGRTSTTLHREHASARASLVTHLVGIALIVVGINRWGITGAAAAFVASRLIAVAAASLVIGPQLLWGGLLGPIGRIVGAAAVMGIAVIGADRIGLGPTTAPLPLALLIAIGAVTYALAAVGLGAATLRETQVLAKGVRAFLSFRARL